MDYITQYYKTRSEQLQEELNQLNYLKILNERQSLGNPTVVTYGRNKVPAGSAGPKPGVRPPTMIPVGKFKKPLIPTTPGESVPNYPPSLDPDTNNPMYPSYDRYGYPFGPGQYPYYFDHNGNPTNFPVNYNFPWLNP